MHVFDISIIEPYDQAGEKKKKRSVRWKSDCIWVKKQGTVKEPWVIRAEKCHFGSCHLLHWLDRGIIKSDSCTINNTPPSPSPSPSLSRGRRYRPASPAPSPPVPRPHLSVPDCEVVARSVTKRVMQQRQTLCKKRHPCLACPTLFSPSPSLALTSKQWEWGISGKSQKTPMSSS